MAQRVGATEAEREQVIAALRAGKSFAEATEALRQGVEQDWFDRNEEHLLEVAGRSEKKAVPKPPEPPKSGKR